MTGLTWRQGVVFLTSLALTSLAALALYGRQIGRHHLRDRTVEIDVPNLPRSFDGYRIVQLSDFHVGGVSWSPRTMARSVALAMRKQADLVVLTGDYVETRQGIDLCRDSLAPLHAPDGVVAVLGNHDYGDRSIRIPAILRALADIGIQVLRNQSCSIMRGEDHLWIVGIDDAHSGHDFVPAALAGVPTTATVVVLSHYPDLAWQLGPDRIAVVLAGHAHGSQIRLPFIGRYARERVARTRFSHGVYRINGTPVFVNTGIGTSGRPLRIMSRPEVATIVLRAVPRSG
jgi:uncharacterized protein